MPDSVVKLVNDWGEKYQKVERKESLEFRNRNKEKYAWDNDEYVDDDGDEGIDQRHASTAAEFPGIDLGHEDDGPAIELLGETDEERVRQAARETGISERSANYEGVTTAVDLVDDDGSEDDDDGSEAPSLIYPESSDDEDSDDDDEGDEGGVEEQEEGYESDQGEEEEATTQRVHVISPPTAGVLPSAVAQLARGHQYDANGRRRSTRTTKRPRNYEPDHGNKKYTEGSIHVNVDMKKDDKMGAFTIQDQIEHVLGVTLAQVYSLKKGLKESGQEGKNTVQSEL